MHPVPFASASRLENALSLGLGTRLMAAMDTRRNLSASLQHAVSLLDQQWQLLGDRIWESSHARQTFLAKVEDANALARQLQDCPWPALVSGVYRSGDRQGEEWGSWRYVSRPDTPCCVEGLETHLDAEPFADFPLKLSWDRGYLRIGVAHGYPRVLHRQWWQDFHNVTLPRWLEVDHGRGGGRRDNRLQNLKLLPQPENASQRSAPALPKSTVADSSTGTLPAKEGGSLLKRRRQTY